MLTRWMLAQTTTSSNRLGWSRWSRAGSAAPVKRRAGVVRCCRFRVDTRTRRIYVCGSEVRLTPREFELFVYFAQHPHCVLTHRDLLTAIWDEEN